MSGSVVLRTMAISGWLLGVTAAILHAARQRAARVLLGRLRAGAPAGLARRTGATTASPLPFTTVSGWFAERVGVDGVPAAALWRGWVLLLAGATAAAAAVAGPGAGLLGAVAILALPWAAPRWQRRVRARRVQAQLPAFLDAVGSGLRAGASLPQAALEAATAAPLPLQADLHPFVRDLDGGQSFATALDGWVCRNPSRSVRLTAAVLQLAAEAGGPQAAAIEGVAATVRDRLAVTSEVRALSSQARASAVVIVAAPVLFAAVSAAIDPEVLAFLTGSPAGLACLAGGAALDGVGAWWMASIARSAV